MIHRFVNTTPNPSATKNNKGELVGLFEPEPSPPLLAVVVAALLEADVGVEDIPTKIEYGNDPIPLGARPLDYCWSLSCPSVDPSCLGLCVQGNPVGKFRAKLRQIKSKTTRKWM